LGNLGTQVINEMIDLYMRNNL